MKTVYQVQDGKGNFVTKFAFQREPSGIRGKIDIWMYFSRTGYAEGSILYPDQLSASKLLNYLETMNYRLGQKKKFKVVGLQSDKLKFSNKIISEKLIVTKYSKIATADIKDL